MRTFRIHVEDKEGKAANDGRPYKMRGVDSPAEAHQRMDIMLREMRQRAVNSGMPDPELRVTKIELAEDDDNDAPLGAWKPKDARPVNLNAYAKAPELPEGDWVGLGVEPQ
jgi:hypothetical protein